MPPMIGILNANIRLDLEDNNVKIYFIKIKQFKQIMNCVSYIILKFK